MNWSDIDVKQLASIVYETLKKNGIDAVLVGGACVSIYSENRYLSYDLDFVSHEDLKAIEKALGKLGFRRNGRCFSHEDCPFLVDFVNPPVFVGGEPVKEFEILETSSGTLKMLKPIDCVKDRLMSFFHWDDEQGLEQAILVAKDHPIDLKNLKHWAKQERCEKKLERFLEKI